MSFISDVARVGLGVATLGGSELVRAGVDAIKPPPINAPAGLTDGSLAIGAGAEQPNPAYAQWQQQLGALQGQLAAASAKAAARMQNPASDPEVAAIRQRIADHQAQKPPATIRTELGQRVDAVGANQQQAQQGIQAGADALNATGQQAQQQGQQVNAQAQQQAANAAQRAAPQMTEQGASQAAQQQAIGDLNRFDPATQGAAALRNFQTNNAGVDALKRFADGPTGPSAAEAMLRLQAARDKAAALSRARSVRGGPGAVAEAMKQAQAEGTAIAADTRGQLAVTQAQESAARRQEQLSALTGMANAIGQQDATQLNALGQASNAELAASGQVLDARKAVVDATSRVRDQDISVLRENLGAQVQTLGLNDQQVRFFSGLGEAARTQGIEAAMQAQSKGIDAQTAIAQSNMQFADLAWRMLAADQQVELQKIAIQSGVDMNNQQQRQAFIGQILGFAGTGLTAAATKGSDKHIKVDIKRARSMADALRSTRAYSYKYRDPMKYGVGDHTGPMAQDLEKTPEFRSSVKEVNGVKMVDTGRLALAHHAALHDLQRQVDKLAAKRERA